MAATEDTDALALAYVEGEMEPSAARAFEARLAGDPALRAEVEGLRAMKELLGADAAFGRDSKTDAPPAHLVESILKAEALARPREIREAAALARNPPPSFTARLARWLLGGGALVAGAAALLFVVVRPTTSEVAFADHAAQAPSLVAAKAEESPLADAKAAAPADAPAAAVPADGFGAATGGLAPEGASAQRAPGALKKADDAPAQELAAEVAKPDSARLGDAIGATDTGAGRISIVVEDEEAEAPARRGDVASITNAAEPATRAGARAEGRAQSGPVAPAAPPPAPKPSEPSLSVDADDAASGFDAAGGGGKGIASPRDAREALRARRLAARGAEQAPAKDAPVETKPRPAAASADKQSVKTGSTSDEAAEKKKAPAAADGAKERAASKLERPDELRAAQEAELAFTTGLRELQARRYGEALIAFENAAKLDRKRILGVSPTVGRMRCLVALKRVPEASVLAGQLLHADLKAPDVVDGLLLGADVAEKTGDTLLATQLWTRLREVPAHRAEADRAIARLRKPLRNKALESDAKADDAAASEAPAAAAPAESR